MQSRWMHVLLLSFLVGCSAPARRVRLALDGGETLTRPLSSGSKPVELTASMLGEALARLVLDVPLSVRPEQAGRLLLASTSGDLGQVDWGLQFALRSELSSAERKLPIGAIWNHEMLVLRLAAEWHPEQEA